MPKKYSFLNYKIQAGKFDGSVLRKKLIDAARKEFAADVRIVANKETLENAYLSFRGFQKFCQKLVDYWSESEDDEYKNSYDYYFTSGASCCGVSELVDLPTTYKEIVSHIIGGYSLIKKYDDLCSEYIKYYDNDKDSAEKRFESLTRLGWKCTGIFINANHDWPNYEFSASYGDVTNV